MASGQAREQEGRTNVKVDLRGSGVATVATGLPVLDHLLALTASRASFNIALEVAPGEADAEVVAAGRAFGEAIALPLRDGVARGYGAAVAPQDEALAQVVLEISDEPRVFSNVDLTEARVGGLRNDLGARFLEQFAHGAGLTLHVRLIEGQDTQHVLEAIFKGLGSALAQACRAKLRPD